MLFLFCDDKVYLFLLPELLNMCDTDMPYSKKAMKVRFFSSAF